MTSLRPVLFLLLLAGSGWVAYRFASGPADTTTSNDRPGPPVRKQAKPNPANRPLLLEDPPLQRVDPTNYDVTVSDLKLQKTGEKIERESRTRLQELTDRYQLTANQRRETFPLLVSHHPDYTEGLVVNGFSPKEPGPTDFASQFSAILNLNQQELFQEDLGADRAWWRDVLVQIREDLEGTRLPDGGAMDGDDDDPGEKVARPDLNAIFGD